MNTITTLRLAIKVRRFTEHFTVFFLFVIICNAALAAYKNDEVIRHNGLIILSIAIVLATARYMQGRTVNDELLPPLGIAVLFGTGLLFI